jgi:transposase-like protein
MTRQTDYERSFTNEYAITMEDGSTRTLNIYQIAEIAKVSPHTVIKKIHKGNRRIESFPEQKRTRPFVHPTIRDRTYFRE